MKNNKSAALAVTFPMPFRTLASFEQALQKSRKGTDFVLAEECCVMINTVLELRSRVYKLCTMSSGENMVSGASSLSLF